MKETIHKLDFGTNVIDHYSRSGTRYDIYTNSDGEQFEESRACLNENDTTAPVTTYNRESKFFRQYSAQCPACWLGHSHTIAYHESHA